MTDNPTVQAVPDEGAASPRLAEVIRSAISRNVVEGDLSAADLDDATAGVLTALREVCMIRSVKQLDALPVGAVVVSPGVVGEYGDRNGEGSWQKGDKFGERGPWFWWAMDYGEPSSEVGLPALLVFHPDWEAR